jgi:hypothetical protein
VVFAPRDLGRTERHEMWCRPLDVEESSSTCCSEMLDECEERGLRGARAAMELRLGGEETADPDAVEPTREPVGVPGLDGVRPAELVQSEIGGSERRVDPPMWSLRVGAGADDVAEGRVDPDLVATRGAP